MSPEEAAEAIRDTALSYFFKHCPDIKAELEWFLAPEDIQAGFDWLDGKR